MTVLGLPVTASNAVASVPSCVDGSPASWLDATCVLCLYLVFESSERGHVVVQVKVRRRGSDMKYVAQVLAVGTECDIGMLAPCCITTKLCSLYAHGLLQTSAMLACVWLCDQLVRT